MICYIVLGVAKRIMKLTWKNEGSSIMKSMHRISWDWDFVFKQRPRIFSSVSTVPERSLCYLKEWMNGWMENKLGEHSKLFYPRTVSAWEPGIEFVDSVCLYSRNRIIREMVKFKSSSAMTILILKNMGVGLIHFTKISVTWEFALSTSTLEFCWLFFLTRNRNQYYTIKINKMYVCFLFSSLWTVDLRL